MYTINGMLEKFFASFSPLVALSYARIDLGNVLQAPTSLEWTGVLTLVIVVLVFVGLIWEIMPPDITLFIGTCVLVITGVLTPIQFLSGFSRPILFTLAMLFILVKALEVNGVLNLLAHKALPRSSGYRRQLACLTVPVSAASAFLNNTPIVLMLTAVVSRWAQERKLAPSKYLMPVSFAAILGGMCTLIGTSTNLIVSGLVTEIEPTARFAFFDLAWVGVPCAILGLLYLIFVGSRLLPERRTSATAASLETREFIAEFQVSAECPFIGKTIEETGHRHFERDYLVEIGRQDQVINSPHPQEIIQLGDRLAFVSDLSHLANLHGIKGLTSLADPAFRLDSGSSHFAEVVVAVNSWLIGKTLRRASFRTHYGASVLAIYRNGLRVPGAVGEVVLHSGDTLLLLSNRPWETQPRFASDFYAITPSQQLPVFVSWKAAAIALVILAMVVVTTIGVPIILTSLGAVALLLFGRLVTLRQAARAIDWHLLLLVASAFALGVAMEQTRVAYFFAKGVLYVVGSHPFWLIGGIYLATTIVTEFITNAAAAMLLFPIAIEMAFLAGYHSPMAIKAVGIAVALAASGSFLTPIGYQTNMIVYGPGGYRFYDYARVGAGLTILLLVLATFLIPTVWPFAS